jgi:hypothetical protein
MAELSESELGLCELFHHPIAFQQFITPVNARATKTLPMQDWLEEDRWGTVRVYQFPTLPWDHMLPESVPIDSGGRVVDRASAGNCYDWGGRATSKSWGGTHDELQYGVVRSGEEGLITSLDEIHLEKRIDLLWGYKSDHPLFRVLIQGARRGPPVVMEWWNGHITRGIIESTSGEGDLYLGTHAHRVNIDEFQLMGMPAWLKLHDAVSEDGRVIRTTGVSDGRLGTPAHDTRNSSKDAPYVHIKPQLLNEIKWTPANKKRAIEIYGGEDSQGYKTNILAQEGDPMAGVWEMDQIKACIETMPEDKGRNIENRRPMPCPVTAVKGLMFKEDVEKIQDKHIADGKSKERARVLALEQVISMIEFPPDRDSTQRVVMSMDVGKRIHPSVVGIWGINEKGHPCLWGMVIFYLVDYEDQGEILKHMIDRYQADCIGIDTTGRGGDAIAEKLVRWRSPDEGLTIVPVVFSSTVEVPDPAQIPDKKRRKRGDKGATKKLGVKYYATSQLQIRFQNQAIKLLHNYGILAEFQTEMVKRSSGRTQSVPETYTKGRIGDHRIDMMRVLEIMLYYMAASQGRRRKRAAGSVMVKVTKWRAVA